MNEWSYTSTPPICLHGVVLSSSTGTTLPFYIIYQDVPKIVIVIVNMLITTTISTITITTTSL
jgi:hypothetical protein